MREPVHGQPEVANAVESVAGGVDGRIDDLGRSPEEPPDSAGHISAVRDDCVDSLDGGFVLRPSPFDPSAGGPPRGPRGGGVEQGPRRRKNTPKGEGKKHS